MNTAGDSLVAAAAERLFSELADPRAGDASDEKGRKCLWDEVVRSGLSLAWTSEELGGSGASVAEGFEIIHLSGRFALAVPLVETLLGGWLLSQGGLASPDGPMTVLPSRPGDRIQVDDSGAWSGRASFVSYAYDAAHFAVVGEAPQGPLVGLVAAADCSIIPGLSLNGTSCDTVELSNVLPVQFANCTDRSLARSMMLMGSVARALQMAGAMQSMLSLCIDYAGERRAFERPISKFQAIQHSLARLASEAAVAMSAATSAADAFANEAGASDELLLEAAAAKIRCAEAVAKTCAMAHQIHGAIGFTEEYVLHRYTLGAMSWREDFGNEGYWAVQLGKFIASRGADRLWPLLAAR